MDTQHLLRPHQRDELLQDKKSLENSLKNPGLMDRGSAMQKMRTIDHQLETQSPKPFSEDEIDLKVRQAKTLKNKMIETMPSQEEMRKSPPGAVGKHQAWEKKHKNDLLKWKNIMLRLNHESSDPDIANFEKHRPKTSTLNMHNAVIPGQEFFMMPDNPEFKQNYDNIKWDSDKEAELQKLRKEANNSKEEIPKKKGMSEENRKAASDRMKARHARDKAAKKNP